MKILVTGGAGFIGSHTCLLLLEKGYEVVVIDSYVNSKKKAIQRVIDILKSNNKINDFNIKAFNGDIRDENILEKIFSESQQIGKPFDAVIHFAGLKAVTDSVSNPLHYWDVNFNGSTNLLRVMNKYNCRTIVFSSSATIYGISNDKPLKENTHIDPINPYGKTKAAIEQLLNDIYNSNPSEWRVVNLRYFNPIGAHFSGRIGESPNGIPNNIFPIITQVASGSLDKLTIFGDNWPTKDGTAIRDYVHVLDLAEGHISALNYLVKSTNKIIDLNIGTGLGTSVLELVRTFERVNNVEIPLEFSTRRLGDCCTVIANNSKALSCLGWRAKRSLEEMCKDGWKWQLLNPKGYT